MSVCAVADAKGRLFITAETDCSEFVLLDQAEFLSFQSGSLQKLLETLHLLFAFDAELFAIVEFALIMAFLTSHYGGRIVRWFGK